MDFLFYFLMAIAASPILIALAMETWSGVIKPRLIPKLEIIQEADKLILEHGADAYDYSATQEHRAWYHCDSFEQAKWKRIKKQIKVYSC